MSRSFLFLLFLIVTIEIVDKVGVTIPGVVHDHITLRVPFLLQVSAISRVGAFGPLAMRTMHVVFKPHQAILYGVQPLIVSKELVVWRKSAL